MATSSFIDIENKEIYLSNSALQRFKDCPLKFRAEYIEDIPPTERIFKTPQPKKENIHIRFGSAIHHAFDMLYATKPLTEAKQAFSDLMLDADPHKTKNTGRGLQALESYYDRWFIQSKPLMSIYVEIPFQIPLNHPPGFKDWNLFYIGVIDKIVQDSNQKMYVLDHKTSSRLTSTDILAVEHESQFRGYYIAAKEQMGLAISAVLADFIVFWPKKTELERELIQYTEEDTIQWKCEQRLLASWILTCLSTNTWPRYGSYGCVTYNSLCEFSSVCSQFSYMPQSIRKDPAHGDR